MSLPNNILVPIDFSESSEHALDYAIELATKLGAKVHLLNAISFPAFGIPEAGVGLTASLIDDLLRDNQAALDKLANTHRKSGTVGEVLLRTGDPRDLILHACEEIHADLIVMSTHGRRGVSRLLLGSVAESVLRTARCPVLAIRAPKALS